MKRLLQLINPSRRAKKFSAKSTAVMDQFTRKDAELEEINSKIDTEIEEIRSTRVELDKTEADLIYTKHQNEKVRASLKKLIQGESEVK